MKEPTFPDQKTIIEALLEDDEEAFNEDPQYAIEIALESNKVMYEDWELKELRNEYAERFLPDK